LPYAEGDLFCVPVGAGRYVLGLIARVAPAGKIVAAYLFGEPLASVPSEASIPSPDRVILVVRVGDLGLLQRSWPVVRRNGRWDRKLWPLPVFGRVELIGGRAWRVEYRNDNPNSRPRETLITHAEATSLPEDSLHGHVALERLLAHRLGVPVQPAAPAEDVSPKAFHLIRCQSPNDARDVALLARQSGLVAEVRAETDDWSVVVHQPLTVPPRPIAAVEEMLREIAVTCGAVYDGFERRL